MGTKTKTKVEESLTPIEVAEALGLDHESGKAKGEPDRVAVLELIRDGLLPLVDKT